MTYGSVLGSYSAGGRTGLCSAIAASDGAGAGILGAWRWSDANFVGRLRAIEIAHLVTTGYTAAQEVGFDIVPVSSWSAAPSGQTQCPISKMRADYPASRMAAADVRISNTGAVTKGTGTEADTEVLGADSMHALAATAGGTLGWTSIDLTKNEAGGYIRKQNEGVVVRNKILQGAAGVGRWFIFFRWDELSLVV